MAQDIVRAQLSPRIQRKELPRFHPQNLHAPASPTSSRAREEFEGLDCVFKASKASRFSDPRRLIIEECFRRFTNQPYLSMITSLYLTGLAEREQVFENSFAIGK